MKTYLQKFIPLVLFIILQAATAHAQWNTNTSVNLEIAGLIAADLQSVPTTDGKMWVAFYHQNAGNYDMRAQLIDADGNKLLGPDGMLVSNQSSGTATFVFNVCVDGSNNLIISMQDQRSGDMQAVLYKISQAGTHLWSPDGVIVGSGLAPYSTVLTNGEVVTAWNESTSNSLKMQKISSSGSTVWTTPVTVMVGSSTTTRGQLIANLNNKFTMVYQKRGVGISTSLYAQQFDNSGTAIYAPLQICSETTSGARYYSIAAEDDITFFGYYSSSGSRFNSYLQRINADGTLPWGINGSHFNTSTGPTDNYQGETSINLKPGSLYVWSVCTFSTTNQSNYGVYIQKFLKTSGARQFTDQGKVVYPISANRDIQAGDLSLVDDDTPMFMSYQNDYKIFATRLDASGNFAWPGNRIEISSTTAGLGSPKGRYGFTSVGPNRCSGIWTEDRGTGEKGYAQGVTIGGLIGIEVTTQGGAPATITVTAGTLQMISTIFPSTAIQSVTWSIVPGTGVATINSSGLVTGSANGTVWAKAIATQDVSVKDSLLITLSNQVVLPPSVITLPATGIWLTEAVLNGTVNANYFSSTVSFEWGLTATYGNTATATPAEVNGNSATPVLASLNGLAPGTIYHYRCIATSVGGTSYGQDLTFTTQCQLSGTLSPISGSQSVCTNSQGVQYTVEPMPNATGYVWSVPAGASISAGNNTYSITVDYSGAAQSGDITVYATDGTCFSTTSQPYPVTVNNTPLAAGSINGVQIVCEGDQGIVYSVAPIIGATLYTWTVPPGAVIASGAGTNSISIDYTTGSNSGDITVYGSNTCGTGPISVPLSVNVALLPGSAGPITGPNHICAAANNTVYSVPVASNAYGYVWTLPAGAIIASGANTNQISVNFPSSASSGTILVFATNGNCLGQTSAPFTVEVYPTPETPVITRQGDTLTSSSYEGNQWYLDGTAIPGANEKHYIAFNPGNYTVVVTLNDCSSEVSNTIIVLPVSLTEKGSIRDFEVYPNPNNGHFDLKARIASGEVWQVEIYDYVGRLIYKQESKIGGVNFSTHIELDNPPSGSYIIVLRNGDKKLYRRVAIHQ